MARSAESIAEVVGNGLCIGCGLCEAVTDGRMAMQMTAAGSLRPAALSAFSADEERQLLAACPGIAVEPRSEAGLEIDPIWGAYSSMRYAWAGDPDVRFRAATGGVLTALGAHLLDSGQVSFVLHVGADPAQPMRSRWVISETAEQVIANAGSRYGPTSPLAGFNVALERDQPFALIAKPCDLNAVHRFAQNDLRVDELCVLRLAMVCGGQSRLEKSSDLLDELDLCEDEVSLFRYRGDGNPGRTRIETRDGRAFEKTYQELWEDEAGWKLESRCILCPDALGEAADIAAADVWPDASPSGEDAGFNGIVVHSGAGEALVESAVAVNALVLGEAITPRQFDHFQPHQVRKKEALAARYAGLAEAGKPVIDARGLRLDVLGERLDEEARRREREGARRRAQSGRFDE